LIYDAQNYDASEPSHLERWKAPWPIQLDTNEMTEPSEVHGCGSEARDLMIMFESWCLQDLTHCWDNARQSWARWFAFELDSNAILKLRWNYRGSLTTERASCS
jgi:hypothetical protein